MTDTVVAELDGTVTARTRRVMGWGVLFVTVTVAQLLRQSGSPSWRTVWAEDGSVWYQGTPDPGHLFEGYAGYLQLPSRMLGFAAHVLPVRDLALYWAIVGAAATSLLAAAVWHLSAQLVTSKVLRALLALNVPFVSSLLLEQTANGVNLIWAYVFVAWWALLFRPSTTRDLVLASLLVALGVTSSALTLAFAPAVLYLLWVRRDRPTRIVAGVYFTAALLQLGVALRATDDSPPAVSHAGDLPGAYAVRALGSLLVGERWLPDAWDLLGWSLAVLATVVVVAGVVLLTLRSDAAHRTLGLLTVAYSVFFFVVPVYGRGTEYFRLDPATPLHAIGTRFTSLSNWLLTSGLAVLFSGCVIRAPARRWIMTLVTAWFAVLAVAGFRGTNPRSAGPEWRPSVAATEQACAGHPERRVVLDVVPYPFDVEGTCEELGFG